jgi:replicative DNA helicase
MTDMFIRGLPIDLVTFSEYLKNQNVLSDVGGSV